MASLKSIIELVVPQYLIITILSPLAAWLLITGQWPKADIAFSIIALSCAMLGFNVLNMIFDRKLDAINKPHRPIPSGRVSAKEAGILSVFFYSVSLIAAAAAGILLLLTIISFIAISFLYTDPVTYLRRYIWSTSLIGSLIYGCIPFLAAWSVSGRELPIAFLLFFGGLIFFIAPAKDLEDVKGERRYGINSMPVLIGRQKTIIFTISGTILLLGALMVLSLLNIISGKFAYASILSAVVFMFLNKDSLAKKYHEKIITQSRFVSINMAAAAAIELIFGLVNILITA